MCNGVWSGPKDQRPILCVHGWQDNGNSFKTLIPHLPENYSYLAIDLPGHGLSSHIYKGLFYRIMEYISVLRRIQHFYNWPKISLIGHSYGSAMSFLFSSLFPKDVDFFIAIDLLKPTSWNSSKDFKNASKDIEKMLKNDVLSNTKSPVYDRTELIERYVKGSHKSLTRKSAEILLERGSREVDEGLYRYTRDVKLKTLLKPYFSQNELLNLSKRIECSVLFIKAEQSPFFESKENVESVMEVLQKNAKLFEYHVLPGTHHLHINTPEIVAPVINSFLIKSGINIESFKLLQNDVVEND
ncbi:valacyclovir hydrolase, putative [Pediculus humanus corporis]|uniref:Valacyclovir hydrolase, putative n=1 Tax=Pediculus humanus subsp. corporis TaxID=121224 RepID=E0VG01_PEDHC|nr:valacyclovir hydrolase, putative [Pediculus humanus corporis]EEB12307.1 valacyclovir hydrolase, putative [Pediculus humanus corporis]